MPSRFKRAVVDMRALAFTRGTEACTLMRSLVCVSFGCFVALSLGVNQPASLR